MFPTETLEPLSSLGTRVGSSSFFERRVNAFLAFEFITRRNLPLRFRSGSEGKRDKKWFKVFLVPLSFELNKEVNPDLKPGVVGAS